MIKNRVLLLAGFTFVLSFSCACANEILLKIDTRCKVGVSLGGKELNVIYATLGGFEREAIILRSGNSFEGVAVYEDMVFDSKQLKEGFSNGKVNVFPINFYQHVTKLKDDDVLVIKKYDCKIGDFVEIKMSKEKRQRLLAYLTYDGLDRDRDCMDFCLEVWAESLEQKKKFIKGLYSPDMFEKWMLFEEECDESKLEPGDAIALFCDIFPVSKLRHWMVVLGDGLYISKCGRGGKIYVHDMKFAMKVYDGSRFFRARVLLENKK